MLSKLLTDTTSLNCPSHPQLRTKLHAIAKRKTNALCRTSAQTNQSSIKPQLQPLAKPLTSLLKHISD